MATPAKRFEDLLIARTGVSSELVARARERQRDGKSLPDALRELGALDGPAWARALAFFARAAPSSRVIVPPRCSTT